MKKLTFLILSFLLLLGSFVSCGSSSNDVNADSTDQSIIAAVKAVEKDEYDVHHYLISFDAFLKEMNGMMEPGYIKSMQEGFSLTPFAFSAGIGVDIITAEDIKGLTVDEIKEKCQQDVDQFVEQNFGSIEYLPISISNVYTEKDNKTKYVFTKQVHNTNKFYDLAVNEVIKYKKYTFTQIDGNWMINYIEEKPALNVKEMSVDPKDLVSVTYFNDVPVEYAIEYVVGE